MITLPRNRNGALKAVQMLNILAELRAIEMLNTKNEIGPYYFLKKVLLCSKIEHCLHKMMTETVIEWSTIARGRQ